MSVSSMEEPAMNMLNDDILLHVVRLLCLEPAPACCAYRGPFAGRHVPVVVTLTRAIRFALVCRMWRGVGLIHLRTAHRAVDVRGCPIRFLHRPTLEMLIIDHQIGHQPIPRFCNLVALRLQGGDTVSDSSLGAMLRTLASCAQLRAVDLGGCTNCGALCLSAIGSLASLTALNLSGFPARAAPHLAHISRCPKLSRLEMSHLSDPEVVIHHISQSLSLALIALALDGCLDPSASALTALPSSVTEVSLRGARLSADAVRCLLSFPALRIVELCDSDLLASPAEQIDAFLAARSESLRWLGLSRCAWLDQHTLNVLRTGLSPCTIEHSMQLPRPPAPCHHPEAGSLDSWEDLDLNLTEHLSLLQLSGAHTSLATKTDAGQAPPLGAAAPQARTWIDHSTPEHYRQLMRSIYHVSQGTQPFYGGGAAAMHQSTTDSHGLRS